MRRIILMVVLCAISLPAFSQSVSHMRNKRNEVKGNKYFYAAYVYCSELKLDKVIPALYSRIKKDKFEDVGGNTLDSLIIAEKDLANGDHSFAIWIQHWYPSPDTHNKDLLQLSVCYLKFDSDTIDNSTAIYLKNYAPKIINELIAICNKPEFKQ